MLNVKKDHALLHALLPAAVADEPEIRNTNVKQDTWAAGVGGAGGGLVAGLLLTLLIPTAPIWVPVVAVVGVVGIGAGTFAYLAHGSSVKKDNEERELARTILSAADVTCDPDSVKIQFKSDHLLIRIDRADANDPIKLFNAKGEQLTLGKTPKPEQQKLR